MVLRLPAVVDVVVDGDVSDLKGHLILWAHWEFPRFAVVVEIDSALLACCVFDSAVSKKKIMPRCQKRGSRPDF